MSTERPVCQGTHTRNLSLSSVPRAQLWLGYASLYAASGAPALVSSPSSPVETIARLAVLSLLLLALSVEDSISCRLPDRLTLLLLATGLLNAAAGGPDEMIWSAAGAALGLATLVAIAVIYEKLRNVAGLGLGDAKLLGAAGSWVGPAGLASVLLFATSAALLVVLTIAFLGRQISWRTALPFGPFLALATWIVWLYGPI